MKMLSGILSVLAFAVLGSCKQSADTGALLENTQTRTEIINAIAGNHGYMTEFMEAMQANDHAMQMMQGNQQMMGQMMQDDKMMGKMMRMMHQQGIMSDDCMQSCQEMMEELGMDTDGMGMSGNGEGEPGEDGHSGHH